MPMTTYKVPSNYQPTPAVIKANPTVKQYSTGQVIKVPTNPYQTNYNSGASPYATRYNSGAVPTGSFLAANGTNARGSTPPIPTGSFLAANGAKKLMPVMPSVNVAPLYGTPTPYNPYLEAKRMVGTGGAMTFNIPTAAATTTTDTPYTGGGGGGWYGGGGGGGSRVGKKKIGNDVNTALNWRIG